MLCCQPMDRFCDCSSKIMIGGEEWRENNRPNGARTKRKRWRLIRRKKMRIRESRREWLYSYRVWIVVLVLRDLLMIYVSGLDFKVVEKIEEHPNSQRRSEREPRNFGSRLGLPEPQTHQQHTKKRKNFVVSSVRHAIASVPNGRRKIRSLSELVVLELASDLIRWFLVP